jgi:dienelactone hydrolase
MDYWAAVYVRRGRAALIVDSHGPRGLDRLESWRLVCSALALNGPERAGDVAVALHALSDMEGIEDDVVLFGASHGGWAAMEFVALASSGKTPPGLSRWPEPPDALLLRVSAVGLRYPYCGLLTGADGAHWRDAPPTLMGLAEHASLVSTPSCLERAEELRRAGAVVATTVIPDADHGFDQRQKSPLSLLPFDAQQRDAAREAVEAFLGAHAP